MRRFIVKGAVFAAILLLINAAFLVFVDRVYFRPYETINPDYEAYLLGDSHASALIGFLEPHGVYNFGMGSDSYEDMLRKAQYLVERSTVKLFIVSADDHTLSLYREENNNADRSAFFSTPTTFGNHVEWFERRFVARYIVLLNSKARDVIRSRARAFFRGDDEPVDSERARWSDLTAEKRIKLSRSRAGQQFPGKESSRRMKEALDDLLSLCAVKGIAVVGIKYPLTEEYAEIVNGLSFGASDVFAGKGVPVRDYTHAFDGHPELFRNQDHLNVYGAESFAALLRKDILDAR